MSKSKNHILFNTRNLSTMAILAAIASVLFLFEIPVVLFYKIDLSSLPVLLGTFAMGPMAGTMVLFVKCVIGLLHSSSQGVGELADFIVTCAMIWPAGLIYHRTKTRKSALLGMGIGTLFAVLLGVLVNLYLMIPFYGAVYGMPVDQIVAMGQALIPSLDSLMKFVLYITAPFNLLKWLLISVSGALLYKPLSPLLHGNRRTAAKG